MVNFPERVSYDGKVSDVWSVMKDGSLELMVEIIDTSYGGKLIPYYKKYGFKVIQSDFPNNFDFLKMKPDPEDRFKIRFGWNNNKSNVREKYFF